MASSSQRRTRRGPIIAEVNMTPLIDLTFLLLVAFMITFPALEQGISVKLPQGQTDKLPTEKAKTITIKNDGKLYFGEKETTADELGVILGNLAAENPETAILIRADESLDYGKVMKVVKMLYKVKLSRMALVTLAD